MTKINIKLPSLFIGLLVVASFFILLSNKASAAGTGFEFIYFRIDTELDVILDTTGGATVTWTCNEETSQGVVTDGTASESDGGTLDGIIMIASTSLENNASNADCDSTETITATVSFSGWVNRTWSDILLASTSIDPFVTRASMDYTIVINGIRDELGNTLTLDGTTASATYSGTVASQSYSGSKRYIAGSTDSGTVTGGGDGYVNRTSTALTISATASQSVDFDTSQDSDIDSSGLLFGHKVSVVERGFDTTNNKVTSGTVTAGDSLGTSCTIGTGTNQGNWYCPVPLSDTETTAQFSGGGSFADQTATYTDRTSGSDSQSMANIVTSQPTGGSSGPTPTPTPVPSPTPMPETTPTPIPTPVPGPVKLFRKVSDPKVYVQGGDGLLRWVRTLEEFNAAGYLWENVQVISGPEFAKLSIDPASVSPVKLFRKVNDPKVYVQGEDGVLMWVRTAEEFEAAGYNWADVQEISGAEFAKLRVGGKLRVVKGIGYLRVRDNFSLEGEIIGKVLSDDEFEFDEIEDGWYKIRKDGNVFGWVFGEYIDEI